MKLANKITIVTGAGRGIGRGIADRFSKEGARVAIIDYKPFEGTLLDGQRFYRGDVSDPGLWEKVVAESWKNTGGSMFSLITQRLFSMLPSTR
jgi:NAD(P)-dependent dehydrogenase (short-subunit alcohol dehydrogenase family)